MSYKKVIYSVNLDYKTESAKFVYFTKEKAYKGAEYANSFKADYYKLTPLISIDTLEITIPDDLNLEEKYSKDDHDFVEDLKSGAIVIDDWSDNLKWFKEKCIKKNECYNYKRLFMLVNRYNTTVKWFDTLVEAEDFKKSFMRDNPKCKNDRIGIRDVIMIKEGVRFE